MVGIRGQDRVERSVCEPRADFPPSTAEWICICRQKAVLAYVAGGGVWELRNGYT
ncbi:hypothetical protein SCLCIDRAFT_1219866 [Scleroderma citrinum Foug A]|uniref:Uncharacterized protein n=1 Tax=Scleroderma citrinum Foug A TaxID=1036808 RepID=A0A0C3DLV3_9AGAM|nr:hypothetical protein SCLCIDRAFT_1219866 [Scleroderma citrinum Foug A]